MAAPSWLVELNNSLPNKVHDDIVEFFFKAPPGGLGFASVHDLADAFEAASEFQAKVLDFVASCKTSAVQLSRTRQLWRAAQAAAETIRKRKHQAFGDSDELDVMLPQQTLDGLAAKFWARYHVIFTAALSPADALVSRLHREMVLRLLSVRDVWAVKTLHHQLRSSRKKRKVSDGVSMLFDDAEDQVPDHQDVTTYLALLFVLMVAYACAGVDPRDELPKDRSGAPVPEKLGSDSCQYVSVPWDVMYLYH